MLTDKDIKELFDATVQDFPLQPVEDLLCIPCETDWEAEIMVKYIHKHYSEDEILKGMDICIKRLHLMAKLCGK